MNFQDRQIIMQELYVIRNRLESISTAIKDSGKLNSAVDNIIEAQCKFVQKYI